METDEKRPNAALINREWYESAQEILTREELGSAVLNAIAYVLYGDDLPLCKSKVGIVCRMIKPALDSDIAKYLERCARNQRNAQSKSQRVAASGTQSQQVVANTTTTSTTTPTTTSTTTISLSAEEQEEREKWLIFGYFWSTGSKAVEEETRTFWSYYESLGWKNNKGAVIMSKIAAARMWKRQYEGGTAPRGADVWYKVLQNSQVNDFRVWRGFCGAEREGETGVVQLRFGEEFLTALREYMPAFEKVLQGLWKVDRIRFEFRE